MVFDWTLESALTTHILGSHLFLGAISHTYKDAVGIKSLYVLYSFLGMGRDGQECITACQAYKLFLITKFRGPAFLKEF